MGWEGRGRAGGLQCWGVGRGAAVLCLGEGGSTGVVCCCWGEGKGGLGLGMEVVGGGHGGRAGGRPASIILINSKGTHSVPNLSLQLAARLQ